MTLRVAYLVTSQNAGGAERQMMNLAERLPRGRFEPEFVVLAGTAPYLGRLRDAGIRVHTARSAVPEAAGLTTRLLRTALAWSRYAAIARAARFDVVDAWLYPMDVMAAVMRPLARTSIVVGGRRNIDPQDRFGPLEAPIRLAVRRFTDIVVANASAAAASAVAQGVDPAKIRIIRNGVEPAAPQSPSELAALRRAMGVDDGDVLIGCVAHYRAEKGHATLIDAVAALIREGLPVRLELVGEGPMRPALERQIRDLGVGDRVTLHGSEPDPLPLYGAFDLVASGSLREGLPNALLEAGAAGRAVIATAAGGSGEVVLDGQTGLIVPIQDAPALASALRHVVTNTALRDRFGAAGRERVATVFGMDRFVAEFATLYEELADGRRGLGGRSHGRGTA